MRPSKTSSDSKGKGSSKQTSATLGNEGRFRGSHQASTTTGTIAAAAAATAASATGIMPQPASPTSSSNGLRRFFKQQSASSAGSQRVAALLQDVKRYWKHQKEMRRTGEVLPHHYHHHHHSHYPSSSSKHHKGKKVWHVDIPKRMILSTMLVFLLLPLTIFYWKETHLPDQEVEVTQSKLPNFSSGQSRHDVFPNWFADSKLPDEIHNQDDEAAQIKQEPPPPQQQQESIQAMQSPLDESANEESQQARDPAGVQQIHVLSNSTRDSKEDEEKEERGGDATIGVIVPPLLFGSVNDTEIEGAQPQLLPENESFSVDQQEMFSEDSVDSP